MLTTTTMAEERFFIEDNAIIRLVACQCCGMEALRRSEGGSAACPRCGVLMSEDSSSSRPRVLLHMSLAQKMLLVASLVLGLVLFATACGGGDPGPEVDNGQVGDEAALQLSPTCQVSIKSLVDGKGLKGVLFKDRDDLDIGTPDVLELEVVTGMYEGSCHEQPELYVNGEPASLLEGDAGRARFLAWVSTSEPEVLLSAYCGQCKPGTWGAVIE
jgi:hypothetical protein